MYRLCKDHILVSGHMSYPDDLELSFNNERAKTKEREQMKGIIFAFIGGACITLQGVANARISQDIGTWQAATITQLTGFIMALLILMFVRDGNLQGFKKVNPLYLIGGALGAVIIFSEVTAIQKTGVTFTISALLIAQLCLTFLVDINGWFGLIKQKMKLPQFIGIGMMVAGVVILKF